MLVIKQITPAKLLANKKHLDEFLKDELSDLITEDSWMTKWEHLAQRFQLYKFKELPEVEIEKLQWDTDQIKSVIEETIYNVKRYLPFNEMHVTVVPALPLSFFQDQPQSLWSNAFTNGPGNILIAIPPNPDIDFFQYLLSHESHHASPENPIYNLTLNTFTLEEWYKMEGTAEYFSLSLYPDKRWWKNNLPLKEEKRYWNECKEHLKSTEDNIKSPLCFGSKKNQIPVFAGYSFALKIVSNYASTNKIKDIRELFEVEPSRFVEYYKRNFIFN